MPEIPGGRELRQPSTPRLPPAPDATPQSGNTASVAPPQPAGSENSRGRTLTYEDLSRCFHLPINAAAKELGVCVTALKKQCRKHGVPRWPHRKLKSLDKLKEKLEKEEATAADKEYYKHEIHSIAQKKDHIFRSNSANAQAAAAAAACSNGMTSAPLPHLLGGTHARPGQPLIMGHPMSPYAAFPIAQKPSTSACPDSEQQHRMIAGQIVMPIAQMPPNGAMIPQAMAGAQQFAPWGFLGQTPVALPRPGANPSQSNGSSSNPPMGVPPNVHFYNPAAYAYAPTMTGLAPYQNMVQVNLVEQPTYAQGNMPRVPVHATMPAAPAAATGNGSQQPQQQQMSQYQQPKQSHPQQVQPKREQVDPTPATPTPVKQPAPSRQQKAQQREAPKGPETPTMRPSPAPPPSNNAGNFRVHGNVAHPNASPSAPPGPPPGVMYSIMRHNMHYDGMGPRPQQQHLPHPHHNLLLQGGATQAHRPVPSYWTEIQHSQTPSNMVTMCNQTVHHHHHHGTDTASPSLAARDPARRQEQDNASSLKTNNSERNSALKDSSREVSLKQRKRVEDDAEEDVEKRQSMDAAAVAARSTSEMAASSIAAAAVAAATAAATASAAAESNAPRSASSQTQSDSKCANSEGHVVANGYHAQNGKRKSVSQHSILDETSSSSQSDDNKKGAAGVASSKRPSKRARTQTSASPGDGTRENGDHLVKAVENPKASTAVRDTAGDKTGRKWMAGTSTSIHNGKSSPGAAVTLKDGQNAAATAASSVNRARRYDHVVHQAVSLASAQWCTDLTFKVTLALGPKTMLGLAGVPSLGRSVLDGTESALEDRATARNKYMLASKGQRLEWIASSGDSRYLVVMNPFRKRNNAEISGVAGLMVELKIIQALST